MKYPKLQYIHFLRMPPLIEIALRDQLCKKSDRISDPKLEWTNYSPKLMLALAHTLIIHSMIQLLYDFSK